ncbi:ATP-dependent nuclease [Verminephrobacter eiseniae]|uniref:ATP-dependent nuclease n=1 Tax=Verminephrobacter eiseniae TaxID=364317 RepID=UPI0010D3886D|nr:AAA family ATPase [Verminephrobacter eiseniae]KAB7598018.1 AAA family ATPase [Verminephrobacter sp. Larva24]MCW5231961.1 chromosome segregation protein SMC [Verminephrobacter eiseniae]MCW5296477.1 chromosome segregation protein SMC [Verminephrobacter eiseniae]MCW8187275.1 chromosome segregation protein SMC [Verminephrobacter eiseniae]MCW8224277.1 chromosome segregation protein SMC [Verminephrobacter eiseniae]
MITKLTLRNFKSVGEQVYEFTAFDLLVGRNNSGKSTVLQAMAIWQFCVDEFHRSRRTGSTGIQVVLPNFTALPVPEFILLWKDRTDRNYPVDETSGKRKQEFILIEILLEWQDSAGKTQHFGVELRYHSPQTMYAIPAGGWANFRECEKAGTLPRIAYVPPFSGLEPTEKRLDVPPMRQQVGKGQPGSVLRNLLLQVSTASPAKPKSKKGQVTALSDWEELAAIVRRWFSVEISQPRYDSTKDVFIAVEYSRDGKDYDIISGGSGFHQTLTLLAFLFGYQPTTILLDEPDAHLHVNLQREILDYFKRKSQEHGIQFLIATHAEEFARGVDASQIVSLLNRVPKRVDSTPAVLRAMADVSNEEVTRLTESPYILYVEGETDERILRAWAGACGAQDAMDKVCFKAMGGGGKANMKERADQHFSALQQIIPAVARLMLFDFDDADDAFHPPANNPVLFEWKRKNIENYLLVPDVWKRAALLKLRLEEDDLFAQSALNTIDAFFRDENLTLPPGKTWRDVSANVFSVVDGKRLLFENGNSLFQQVKQNDPPLQLIREEVALAMETDEIHEDVHAFIGKLKSMTGSA